MLSLIGGGVGILFCLYSIVFRWNIVMEKYGRISLYSWVLAVTTGCSLIGYLAQIAIWGAWSALWRISN